jgi:hypothetical protein
MACGCPEALTPIWTSGRLAEAAGKPIEMAAIFMAKICKTPWIHLISESIFDISMGSSLSYTKLNIAKPSVGFMDVYGNYTTLYLYFDGVTNQYTLEAPPY